MIIMMSKRILSFRLDYVFSFFVFFSFSFSIKKCDYQDVVDDDDDDDDDDGDELLSC